MIEAPSRLNRSHLETLVIAIHSPFATAREMEVLLRAQEPDTCQARAVLPRSQRPCKLLVAPYALGHLQHQEILRHGLWHFRHGGVRGLVGR